MNNQKNFTNKVNEMILYGKSQGLSTKGISDKWHTFGDLYYHRMILTLLIMRQNKDKAWKSKQHHDGTMFDDSFICGINTPKGQYSYHYDLEYWNLFNVKELEKAPEYDGHKPEDITRLLSLEEEQTTEELGVLQSKNNKNYYMARKSQVGLYKMTQFVYHAFKLTRKEAEQFPQFKFVPLKELEG